MKKKGPYRDAGYYFDKFDDMLVEKFVLQRLISINGLTHRLVEQVAIVGNEDADLMILVELVNVPPPPESEMAVSR